MFPYEYQRALKQMSLENQTSLGTGDRKFGPPIPKSIKDIEETVTDSAFQRKKFEKVLDKTR